MDMEIDIKKIVKKAGYTGQLGDNIAKFFSKVRFLSDLENSYSGTPAKIYGVDKWGLLRKLRAAAVAPDVPAPQPAVASAPADEKKTGK